MTRKSLYTLTLTFCAAGYLWILLQFSLRQEETSPIEGVCLIKTTTGIPCPSCGSTRSVVSLFEGRILDAIYWNPLGLFLAAMLIILPIWVLIDIFGGKSSFHRAYLKMESIFKSKIVLGTFLLLILSNWIWNIMKGL